jgi:hypothetical protein
MRLIGDGGGGLPLPLAFGTVVEHLLDHHSATFDELEKLLAQWLAFKETRILSTAWRTWADFTHDILDQISGVDDDAVPILFERDGHYYVDAGFKSGVEYVAIKQTKTMFTVYNAADRIRRDKEARIRMDLKGGNADLHARLDKYAKDSDIDPRVLDFIQSAHKSLLKAAALVGEQEVVFHQPKVVDEEEKPPKPDVSGWEPITCTNCGHEYPASDYVWAWHNDKGGYWDKRKDRCSRCRVKVRRQSGVLPEFALEYLTNEFPRSFTNRQLRDAHPDGAVESGGQIFGGSMYTALKALLKKGKIEQPEQGKFRAVV